jgi:hypothetical protein
MRQRYHLMKYFNITSSEVQACRVFSQGSTIYFTFYDYKSGADTGKFERVVYLSSRTMLRSASARF